MGLHKGLTEEYTVDGTKVLFRRTQIGDVGEKPLEEIICGTHCSDRFLDEVLGAPDDRQRLRVVKKYSIPRHQLEEDDF